MKPESTRPLVPAWARIGLVVLGLPNVLAGLWGTVAPRSWFDSFPGWDPRLVAAEPPYNAHLATDAGAGLLASGVVLVAAAWLADTRSVRLALLAFAAFSVPHAAYHAANPAPGLTAAEDAQNVVLLVFIVVAAVVLFVGARDRVSGVSGAMVAPSVTQGSARPSSEEGGQPSDAAERG